MKKLLYIIAALGLLTSFSVSTIGASVSNEVSSKERDLAKNIQKHEFEKNTLNNKIKSLESKINKNEEKIKALEVKIESKLKKRLKKLTKKESVLKRQYDDSSWWESFSIKKLLKKNEIKKSGVKTEIEESNAKLDSLKQNRVKLDEDYAVMLQNQEFQNATFLK